MARLVTAAAIWGRNVVASSATLSEPVAKVLFDAFAFGIEMHNALEAKSTKWRQAVIDDRASPLITSNNSSEEFLNIFKSHIDTMMSSMGVENFRPAEMQKVLRTGGQKQGESHVLNAIEEACKRMHQRHGWDAPENSAGFTGKLSIGLVRMANIRPAIAVARHLAEKVLHVRICCYHAQLGLLQRWNIEKNLDSILSRKNANWAEQTVQNEYILQALRQAVQQKINTVSIIIVATPVEEIGRDHDFDWAVIEPSSAQSIVQTAGRVNRHRLTKVDEPNVAVLQFNYRTCTKFDGKPVFCQPGLETDANGEKNMYGDHDIGKLLNWTVLTSNGQIDARLRYQKQDHKFAAADDQSLTDAVTKHMKYFIQSDKYQWLLKDTYTNAPLRDRGRSTHEELCIKENGEYYRLVPSGKIGKDFKYEACSGSFIERTLRHENDWLVLSFEETCKLADTHKITIEKATSVQILTYDDDASVHIDLSFGYSPKKNSF